MFIIKTLACFFVLFVTLCNAQSAKEEALRDIQLGMQGLQEAAKNPMLLTQMLRDLQDPEIMAEAQKMMDNPEFKKQMEALQKDKGFKDAIKTTQDKLNDPNEAAAYEAKVEHMLKVGEDQMKKAAGSQIKEAMDAMANPEVMAEMAKMMKDPQVLAQIQQMTSDPNFKSYIDAVKDMSQDPAMKKKLEGAAQKVRQEL